MEAVESVTEGVVWSYAKRGAGFVLKGELEIDGHWLVFDSEKEWDERDGEPMPFKW